MPCLLMLSHQEVILMFGYCDDYFYAFSFMDKIYLSKQQCNYYVIKGNKNICLMLLKRSRPLYYFNLTISIGSPVKAISFTYVSCSGVWSAKLR